MDRIGAMREPPRSAGEPEPPTILLSRADLAREFRVSAKAIDRMDQAGRLPRPIRMGTRAKRWPRQTIVAWIAAGAPNRRGWEQLNERSD